MSLWDSLPGGCPHNLEPSRCRTCSPTMGREYSTPIRMTPPREFKLREALKLAREKLQEFVREYPRDGGDLIDGAIRVIDEALE